MEHAGNDTGGTDMDMGGGMMMMQMFFYVSSKATILFESWSTSSPAGMFGSFVAVFFAAMVYESVKVLRSRLIQTATRRARQTAAGPPTEHTQLTASTEGGEHKAKPQGVIFSKAHMIQTVLHLVQATLGYSLMLVAMTFNLWLFLAVVTGMTAGYFAFGWMHDQAGIHDDCCA